jgi:hypothetical protein
MVVDGAFHVESDFKASRNEICCQEMLCRSELGFVILSVAKDDNQAKLSMRLIISYPA